MLVKSNVYIVFSDFSSMELLGEWYTDFTIPNGFGSQQALTDHLAKVYAKEGKKIQYLSIFKA